MTQHDMKMIPNPQAMIADLLLWHQLSKERLAEQLGINQRTLNGILFKGYIEAHTLKQLITLYRKYVLSEMAVSHFIGS